MTAIDPAAEWRTRMPLSVLEWMSDPDGVECETSMDRRMLWHVVAQIPGYVPAGSPVDQLARDLTAYLRETCQHVWYLDWGVYYEDDPEEFRQCLWCYETEWRPRS